MENFYEAKTNKTALGAEIIAQTTLNDLRNKYSPKISAEEMLEAANLAQSAIKHLPQNQRISGLVGALMFELL
jgi:hypothetical protein